MSSVLLRYPERGGEEGIVYTFLEMCSLRKGLIHRCFQMVKGYNNSDTRIILMISSKRKRNNGLKLEEVRFNKKIRRDWLLNSG